jgi:hypothetical protein
VSLLGAVEAAVKGQRVVPAERWAQLAKQFRLIGVQGVVRMAMSAFDTACWDALAIAANVPLVEYLGGARRPIPAYNSCGLGLMPTAALADEAEQLLEGGFGAVKLRLGYPTLEEDIAALHAVRARVPAAIRIMVDFNQALSVDEALKRGRALDGEGVYWIEEPIRHDDYRGAATLARELVTPIQIGENFSEPHSMAEALEMQACDYAMPDLERIGGVTGWRGAAALAAARAVPDVIAFISGSQRASACGNADRALARICGLGRRHRRRAARDRRWPCGDTRAAGQRIGVEQGSRRALSDEVTLLVAPAQAETRGAGPANIVWIPAGAGMTCYSTLQTATGVAAACGFTLPCRACFSTTYSRKIRRTGL